MKRVNGSWYWKFGRGGIRRERCGDFIDSNHVMYQKM